MPVKFEQTGDGDYLLDACGYVCPHPQMYTKKALSKLSSGDTLTLVFDNASSGESIMAMCDSEGNDIIEQSDNHGTFTWKIQKG